VRNAALFLGGPCHYELHVLKDPKPVVDFFEPTPLAPLAQPFGLQHTLPYRTVKYQRYRCSAQITTRALGSHHDFPLQVLWDVYYGPDAWPLFEQYRAMVGLLLAVTGQLETGGAGVWLVQDWLVDG
jgi:hypothetical protein